LIKLKINEIGLDEVGRGAWAGPVVSAAVGLSHPIVGLKDSKKLSIKQRQRLSVVIHKEAFYVGIGVVDNRFVDQFGLSQAVKYSMLLALVNNRDTTNHYLVDGNYNYLEGLYDSQTIIKGDDKIYQISAASIVAKVFRDELMARYHEIWPQYGFNHHVGYGTSLHRLALDKIGICPIHRQSFRPVSDYRLSA